MPIFAISTVDKEHRSRTTSGCAAILSATLDFSDGPAKNIQILKSLKIEIFDFSNFGTSLLG